VSWPSLSLDTIVTIKGGGTPSKKIEEYWNGDIPWVSVKDFKSTFICDSQDKITKAGVENSATNLIPSGSIIIPTRMALGKVGITTAEVAINQDLKALLIKDSSKVDLLYLARFLESKAEDIIKQGKGATVKGITLDVLKNIKIPLPPLPVQKQIAAVLEKADTLRSQCQQMEQELNSLAQSVFLDMFGDPVNNPYDWLKLPLSELSEVKGGLQVTHKRETNPIEVPYLRVANVYRDYLALEEIKTIKVTEKELERTKLLKGDMLVVEGHGNKLEIGRTSIWDDSIENCTHQNHLIRVRFDNTKIRPQFVSCYLNSEGGRLQVLSLSKTTSGLNTISANNVRSINLIVPPLDMQDKYLKIHDEIQSKVMLCNENRLLLQENFNSLMQRAFKGELDLKDVA